MSVEQIFVRELLRSLVRTVVQPESDQGLNGAGVAVPVIVDGVEYVVVIQRRQPRHSSLWAMCEAWAREGKWEW